MRLVRRWAHGQGVGVVAVLHDLNLALRYADDVLVLAGGQVRSNGPAAEVLTPELIGDAWGVHCQAITSEGGVPQCVFA